jgi:hypothetical protein
MVVVWLVLGWVRQSFLKGDIMTDYKKMIEEYEQEELNRKNKMVDHPPHYNQSGIECIDAIQAATEEGFEYYLQGNIIKYLWRYRYKNGVEDLNKAQWYLTKLINIKEKNND